MDSNHWSVFDQGVVSGMEDVETFAGAPAIQQFDATTRSGRKHGAGNQPIAAEADDRGGDAVYRQRRADGRRRRAAAISKHTIHPQQHRDDEGDNRDLPDLDAEIKRGKRGTSRAPAE